MPTQVTYGMIDHSGERTGVQLWFPDIAADGGNWDDLFTTALTNRYDVIKIPLAALTLCNLTRSTASAVVDESAATIPADAQAQREKGMRFFYVDTVTGDRGNFTVPAPDDAAIPSGTDQVNMANAVVAAFVTVVEANAVSRDGNPIDIQSARIVGRNS